MSDHLFFVGEQPYRIRQTSGALLVQCIRCERFSEVPDGMRLELGDEGPTLAPKPPWPNEIVCVTWTVAPPLSCGEAMAMPTERLSANEPIVSESTDNCAPAPDAPGRCRRHALTYCEECHGAAREDRTSHAAGGLTQRADNHRQSACASCDQLQNALDEALWIIQMRVHPDDIASAVEEYQLVARVPVEGER